MNELMPLNSLSDEACANFLTTIVNARRRMSVEDRADLDAGLELSRILVGEGLTEDEAIAAVKVKHPALEKYFRLVDEIGPEVVENGL